MSDIILYNQFIAGIELAGKKLPNGKIRAHSSGTIIDKFPKEFTINDTTFVLENVVEGKKGYISHQYC